MRRYAHTALLAWAIDVLLACGVSTRDAATTAGFLVRTSLRGIDTHGIVRMPSYVERLRRGDVSATAQPHATWSHGALQLDGQACLGQVAMALALEEAMERASAVAAVACSIGNCGHLAALGIYAVHAAERGLVALLCQNTPAIMAVPGSGGPMIGNNPIAFAAPIAGDVPMVFDMASSAVSRGLVAQAARDQLLISEEWAVDREGRVTTDALRALSGAMQPMAAHKGLGLAMLVQCFAASLSGIADDERSSAAAVASSSAGVGAFLLVVNPALFAGREAFDRSVSQWLSLYLRNGGVGTRYPGQRQAACEAERLTDGIPVSPSVAIDLSRAGVELGVPFPRTAD